MQRNDSLSQEQIRIWLKTLQRQNALGGVGPTLKSVSERCSLDRSTLYACIDGDHIELHSQIRLSRVIKDIEEERLASGSKPSRIFSIAVKSGVPTIGIGISINPLLRRV